MHKSSRPRQLGKIQLTESFYEGAFEKQGHTEAIFFALSVNIRFNILVTKWCMITHH